MMEDEFETVQGNGSDKDYRVVEHEQHLFHVRLEAPEFDQRTGKKTSTPMIQKFHPKEFELSKKIGGFAQYKVEVLHDPTKGASQTSVKADYVAADPSNPNSIVNDQNTDALGSVNDPLPPGTDVGTPTAEELSAGAAGETESKTETPVVAYDKGFKKADYQVKYNELYGEIPDAALTVPELKEAIDAKLNEEEDGF